MAAVDNHLIERLPRKDRLRLRALCKPVQLVPTNVLCEPGRPTGHVYFPTEGFISLATEVDEGPGVEVGMVGREGMLGVHLALGVASTLLHAVVQGAGAAWRIDVRTFRSELVRSVALQRTLNRYVVVLMAQLAASAGCQRFHLIGPRLARWLLMSQDRGRDDSLRVTHESLACLLGVRRVGITNAASALQRSGLIAYRRGDLRVLDRSGLEAAACGCYAADCKAYAGLLPASG